MTANPHTLSSGLGRTARLIAVLAFVLGCGANSQDDGGDESAPSSRLATAEGALTALPKPGKDVVLGPNDCSIGKPCPSNCSGCGLCRFGQCFCNPGFEGTSCEKPTGCPNACSERGVCLHGQCFCQPGYSGESCEKSAGCPAECSKNGICWHGRCFCNPGFEGESCEKSTACPANCTGNGVCFYGKCFCSPGYEGESCEKTAVCPANCSKNGQCRYGQCFCNPGFEGESCEKPSPCTNDCSGKGVCLYGKCFCVEGRSGDDCSLVVDGDVWQWDTISLSAEVTAIEGQEPGVHAHADGRCLLSGSVTIAGAGATIGVLPEKCRPTGRLVFAASTHGSSVRVDVLPSGELRLDPNSPVTEAPVSLDGILFAVSKGEPLAKVEALGAPLDGTTAIGVAILGDTCALRGTAELISPKEGAVIVLGLLPETCRPPGRLSFAANKSGGTTRVDVLPDGRVYRYGDVGPGWISLDGIAFSRTLIGGLPLSLDGGWTEATDADGTDALEHTRPSYHRNGGLCVLSGLARRGPNAKTSTLTTLPKECRPSRRLVFRDAHSPTTLLAVDAESGVVERVFGDGGEWSSLDGVVFFASE
ncbi:MAG: hypothetical protein IV100_07710 [Myxococcales bacterium]|nr:hypothetical protein [Myxococcales bacterium]